MTIKNQDDVRLIKSTKDVWNDTLGILSKKLKRVTFETWIKPAQLLQIENNEATLGVGNDMMRTMICQHKEAVTEALSEATRTEVVLRVVVDATVRSDYAATIASIAVMPPAQDPSSMRAASAAKLASSAANTSSYAAPSNQLSKSNLNPKYTFDTFVVGSHNRFVHSAALAVAAKPGQAYNPLFLYGGVGLGKTHIMQAIGHEILKQSPHTSVRYISCEKFTNELINSIRDDRMIDFRKRYRQVDVLLVDDIQFLQGKESTQEEFFHTFNALRDSGHQLVLSSDRPPKAIALLEERLRSRFEWGLIADIQIPDLETRVAILRKKCDIDGLKVSGDALEYIASLFTNNIRELEGALIRVHAYASMSGGELTAASLRTILQPVGTEKQKKTLTIEQIIDLVASHYRIEASEIRSAKRSQDLALPRHIAMYLAHEIMQMSFPKIGQSFGNRKHTSALYAHSRIRDAILVDADLAYVVKRFSDQLAL